jgi:tRNA threonylcarbamoyladenosine biosynthesis protein TsaB
VSLYDTILDSDGKASKNILAIDTTASIFSVALAAGDDQWYFEADAGTLHSRLIMESIDFLFRKASLAPEDLSAVFCMRGPGSFTGLRIGFSSAKGLALALGIPFVSVSSLDCLARPYSVWPGIVLPVIDAKKNAYFYALYCKGIRLSPDADADLPAIVSQIKETLARQNSRAGQILLTGPDAEKLYKNLKQNDEGSHELCYYSVIAPDFRRGSAKDLLAIAKEKDIINNDPGIGPDYIRKSDAELNAKG